jgi:hypothetical protein
MAKYKTFYANESEGKLLDEAVSEFLEKLEEEGHTLIRVNTITYGESQGYMDCFRTEIVYRENHTREVITEKTK